MLRGTLVPGGPHPEAWVWIDDSEESVNGVSKWVCGADAWMEWEGFLRCGRRFADGDVGPLDNGDGPRRKSPCAQVGGYDRHDPGRGNARGGRERRGCGAPVHALPVHAGHRVRSLRPVEHVRGDIPAPCGTCGHEGPDE